MQSCGILHVQPNKSVGNKAIFLSKFLYFDMYLYLEFALDSLNRYKLSKE